MRSLAEFVKTTLVGGILIVLPIYVAILLIAKATGGLLAVLNTKSPSRRLTGGFPDAGVI